MPKTENDGRGRSRRKWKLAGPPRSTFSNLRTMGALVLALLASPSTPPSARAQELESATAPLTGEEAESFLRTAEVLDIQPVPVGVTKPRRLTLSDGRRQAEAIFKDIHVYEPIYRFADGGVELGFRDSYRHEIAAYELDKLLNLGMVPPTVARRVRGRNGSLQLWIEGSMSETERRHRGLPRTDVARWNRQVHTLRMVRQLLDDSDFNNISNVLLGPDSRVWAIDHSRGFRLHDELRNPASLERFSRRILENLRKLDDELVKKRLSPWLNRGQIRTLLIRRALILEHADRLVAERGEAEVLFDGESE